MSDAADFAAVLVDASIAAGLARVDAAIPAGVAGECDECGEHMPRLVGGRCGFCRDGRRPPLSTFDRLPPADVERPRAAPVPPQPKEAPLPAYKDGKYVSVPCDGPLLKQVEEVAGAMDVSVAQAAVSLIEDGLRAVESETAPATPEPRDDAPVTVVSLETVPFEWLSAEIERRLGRAVEPELFDAALARAVAAEGQVATVRQQLRGIIGAEA